MSQPVTRIFRILIIVGILLAASVACGIRRSATPAAGGPSVVITNPLPDQTGPVGEPLTVDSTSTDENGIQRVELWVDDTLYRVDSNPDTSSPYIVSQSWQSDVPGAHIIVVKAFDGQETEGRSQPVTITLGTQTLSATQPARGVQASPTPSATLLAAMQEPTRTPTPAATPTPLAPTNTPVVTCTPPSCTNDEVYYCPDACPGGCGTQCATPTATATPPSFEPTGVETHEIFETVWEQPEVRDYLGYPTKAAIDDRHYARQYFERGYLYWWDQPDGLGQIWSVEISQPGARQGFRWTGPYQDTWDGGDSYSCDAARANPDGPIRGFGKLWCDNPEISKAIGAARGPEQGTGTTTSYGVVQFFQGGVMLYSPLDREVWVLFNGGTWQRHAG
jgi:hypothetical protein